MSRRESVLRGAAALALAGLLIKIGNLLVRLPLTRLVGSEGLGIYQMALPAYNALLHLADGVDLGLKPGAVAAHRLRLLRPVPQRRVLDPCVQLIELSKRDIPVKDAS